MPTKEEVRAARLEAKLSQREAAEVIGYATRTWEDWEAGKRNMRKVVFEAFLAKTKYNGRRK